MRALVILLSLILLAGCAVVPTEGYHTHDYYHDYSYGPPWYDYYGGYYYTPHYYGFEGPYAPRRHDYAERHDRDGVERGGHGGERGEGHHEDGGDRR